MNPEPQKRTPQTLFMSQEDLKKAIIATTNILNSTDITKDENGYTTIDALCEKLKAIYPQLSYINRNHIVELYFKDFTRKIFISGENLIKYKVATYVEPPAILYFGTLERIARKMLQYGIKSDTKGYIKLYDKPSLAADFARKFLRSPDDRVQIFRINAQAAHQEGLKFSTFVPNQYIVVRIDKKFILGMAS